MIGEYVDIDEVDGEEIAMEVFIHLDYSMWKNLLTIIGIKDTVDIDEEMTGLITFIRKSGFQSYKEFRVSYGN